jgi:hypothetical protein
MRPLQPENVSIRMLVTPKGIVIEVRLAQPAKEAAPIDFTLSGIVTEVRL